MAICYAMLIFMFKIIFHFFSTVDLYLLVLKLLVFAQYHNKKVKRKFLD